MKRGLLPAAGLPLRRGIEAAFSSVAEVWPRAVAEGLVTGTVEQAQAAYIGALPQRALTERQKDRLEESLAAVGLVHLLELQGAQDRAFLDALQRTYEKAGREQWTKSRYKAEVIEVVKRFSFGAGGAEAGVFGPAALAWIFSAILAPYYEQARRHTVLDHPVIFPYLIQITKADDKVRENHAALHGFVARADWNGWERECMAPLGWNCRCRAIEVPWFTARELGWSGLFPLGTEKLVRFRSLGGADQGFPRELFVVGAAVPAAA